MNGKEKTTGAGVEVERRAGVGHVTLEAPPLNILTVAMMNRIAEALAELGADPELRAVAVTARGKAFSAGADVGEHRPEQAPALMEAFGRMFARLEALELPVVMAVNGAALGGGFELAIMADVLLASDRAVFGQPEIRLGFIAPVGLARLPALVGPARAMEITCGGRHYSAAEMHAMGLVSRVVPEAELAGALEAVLEDLRRASAPVMRLNVRTLKRVAALPAREARVEAQRAFLDELMPLEDVREGIASFYEKRRPAWKNR